MNLKIFRYYIMICEIINIQPSFKGLAQFKKFYSWECECSGSSKMD